MTTKVWEKFSSLKELGLYTAPQKMNISGERHISFESPAKINNMPIIVATSFEIGAYSYLRGGIVKALQSIGRYTSIGPNCIIAEAEHPIKWMSSSPAFYDPTHFAFVEKKTAESRIVKRTVENDRYFRNTKSKIGNDVWIGANVIIRRGVAIGDGAIIAAGAVVLEDVLPYDVVGGVPAKRLGRRFEDERLIDDLQNLRWWEFDASDLAGAPLDQPNEALKEISRREASAAITRRPKKFTRVVISDQGFYEVD